MLRKFKERRSLLVVSLAVLVTLSCGRSDSSQVRAVDSPIAGYTSLVSVCMAAQGNGMNLPATIGWMAEIISIRANEANRIQGESGRTTYLDLSCFSSSSSGSAAAAILTAILDNRNLIKTE